MEGFAFLSIPQTIHNGLRVLLKNSFIHTEQVTEALDVPGSASRRSHSAPPRVTSCEARSGPTTLMVRNIPTKFTQGSLLENVKASYDTALIDFFYLPIDFKSYKNLGYAFINFVSHEALCLFNDQFTNKRLSPNSGKMLALSAAKIQGLEKNYNLFKSSSVMTYAPVEFRPMVKCRSCGQLCAVCPENETMCEQC